jgi:hypothetical protein
MNCPRCNGAMERGFTTAAGLVGGDRVETREAQILFVVPGMTTSSNPVEAFKQGLHDEAGDRYYPLVGTRCSSCGLIEFYGDSGPAA